MVEVPKKKARSKRAKRKGASTNSVERPKKTRIFLAPGQKAHDLDVGLFLGTTNRNLRPMCKVDYDKQGTRAKTSSKKLESSESAIGG